MQLTSVAPAGRAVRITASALALLIIALPVAAQKAAAPTPTTLERIKASGKVRFGYRADAQPFSYKDPSGTAAGYSVALCQKVAEAIKTEAGLPSLNVEWVPVSLENRFTLLRDGQVDALCGADTETLARRGEADFSIPIFPGGVGALLRTDAPPRLKEILSNQPQASPTWRAQAGALVSEQKFAVVTGTTAQPWLEGKLKEFKLTAKVVPVDSYGAGIQALLDRKADVFFADRAILFNAVARNPNGSKLHVLDRYFTFEALHLAVPRGDPGFRLLVDRTLSRLSASGELETAYADAFGKPDGKASTFFRWTTLSE